MALLGDRNEIPEMAQFHLPYPLDMDIAISILWINCPVQP
jgi:hypothetical protein